MNVYISTRLSKIFKPIESPQMVQSVVPAPISILANFNMHPNKLNDLLKYMYLSATYLQRV